MLTPIAVFVVVPGVVVVAVNLISMICVRIPFASVIEFGRDNWIVAAAFLALVTAYYTMLHIFSRIRRYRKMDLPERNEPSTREGYGLTFPGGQSAHCFYCDASPPSPGCLGCCWILLCGVGVCFLVASWISAGEWMAALYHSPIFIRFNLFFFLGVVLLPLQFVLRREALSNLSWTTLASTWLKVPAIGAMTIGGFGVVATSDLVKSALLQLAIESPYANVDFLIPATIGGVGLMAFALIFDRVGRSRTTDKEGHVPPGWFYTAFALAFLSNLLVFSVVLTSIFLTLNSHYASVS